MGTMCLIYVGSGRYLAEWSACEYDDIMDISLVGNKSESTYNIYIYNMTDIERINI